MSEPRRNRAGAVPRSTWCFGSPGPAAPQKGECARRRGAHREQRLIAGLVLLLALGCLSSDRPVSKGANPGSDELSAAIAELEVAIAEDQKRLEAFVTQPRDSDRPELHQDEALRALAERLTRNRSLLEEKRRARGAAAESSARP